MALSPKLGGDPEVILVSKELGTIKRALEYIGTNEVKSIDAPGNQGSFPNNPGTITIDGLLAEIHPTPSTCREWVLENIRSCLNTLMSKVIEQKGDILVASTVKVPNDVLTHATAEELELGCEPDYSAYSGEVNIIPTEQKDGDIRTGGGHMHFSKNRGYDRNKATFRLPNKTLCDHEIPFVEVETFEPIAQKIILAMDYVCGLPCVLLDDDNAAIRRKLYGKAGAYRIQPHGIEYRVLSNFWVYHPALASLAYQLGRSGYFLATECPNLFEEMIEDIKPDIVQKVINLNDKDGARELVERVLPYYQKIPHADRFEYPIEFAMFVDVVGKENIFTGNLVNNWVLIDANKRWNCHNMGYRNFIKDCLPSDIKNAFNVFGYDFAKRIGTHWGDILL